MGFDILHEHFLFGRNDLLDKVTYIGLGTARIERAQRVWQCCKLGRVADKGVPNCVFIFGSVRRSRILLWRNL